MALLEIFEVEVGRCTACGIIVARDRMPLEQLRGCRLALRNDGGHSFFSRDMAEIMFDVLPHHPITPEWVASIWVDELWPGAT